MQCCLSALTDMFSAGVAVFGVQRLVAVAAVRPALSHDVPLAAQHRLTLKTTEVLHVPVPALSLRTLVRKDDLITTGGARYCVSHMHHLCFYRRNMCLKYVIHSVNDGGL